MSEFKVIETQEQLNEIIKKRLEREKLKVADYDDLAEKVKNLEADNLNLKNTIKTYKENEGTNLTKISELEKTVSGWEHKALQQKVAISHNLPFDLASRLVGDSEESLNEDAERLASLVNLSKSTTQYTQPLADPEQNVNTTDAAWKGMLSILK